MSQTPWSFERAAKPSPVDEPVNRRFHRPLAYLALVAPWEHARWQPSPTLLTVISLSLGASSGWVASHGSAGHRAPLAVGLLLFFLAVVFDNADGMLARVSGRTSTLGAALDAIGDVVTGVSFWAGLCVAVRAEIALPTAQFTTLSAATLLMVFGLSGVYYAAKASYLKLPPAAQAQARLPMAMATALGLSTAVLGLYAMTLLGLLLGSWTAPFWGVVLLVFGVLTPWAVITAALGVRTLRRLKTRG